MEPVPEKNTLSQILSFLVDLEEQSSLNGQPTIDTSSDEDVQEKKKTIDDTSSSDEDTQEKEDISSDEEKEKETEEEVAEEPVAEEPVAEEEVAEEVRLEEEVNLIEVIDAVVFKKKMFWCC